jgi:hypothetical protein
VPGEKAEPPAAAGGSRSRAAEPQIAASITDLASVRRQKVDQAAGPWWPSWRACHSWTAAS